MLQQKLSHLNGRKLDHRHGLALATGFPYIDSARTDQKTSSDELLRRNVYRSAA
jgi:hypothetical protein